MLSRATKLMTSDMIKVEINKYLELFARPEPITMFELSPFQAFVSNFILPAINPNAKRADKHSRAIFKIQTQSLDSIKRLLIAAAQNMNICAYERAHILTEDNSTDLSPYIAIVNAIRSLRAVENATESESSYSSESNEVGLASSDLPSSFSSSNDEESYLDDEDPSDDESEIDQEAAEPYDAVIFVDFDGVVEAGSSRCQTRAVRKLSSEYHEELARLQAENNLEALRQLEIGKDFYTHYFDHAAYFKIFINLCSKLNILAVLGSQNSTYQEMLDDSGTARNTHENHLLYRKNDMYQALDELFGEDRTQLTKAHAEVISEGVRSGTGDDDDEVPFEKRHLMDNAYKIPGCRNACEAGKMLILDDNSEFQAAVEANKNGRSYGFINVVNSGFEGIPDDTADYPEYRYQRNKVLFEALLRFKSPIEILLAFNKIEKTDEFDEFRQFFMRYLDNDYSPTQEQVTQQLSVLTTIGNSHGSESLNKDIANYCKAARAEMDTVENRRVLSANTTKLTQAVLNPSPENISKAQKQTQKDWGVRSKRAIWGASTALCASLAILCAATVVVSIFLAPISAGATLGFAIAGVAALVGLGVSAAKLATANNSKQAKFYDKSMKVLDSAERIVKHEQHRAHREGQIETEQVVRRSREKARHHSESLLTTMFGISRNSAESISDDNGMAFHIATGTTTFRK